MTFADGADTLQTPTHMRASRLVALRLLLPFMGNRAVATAVMKIAAVARAWSIGDQPSA
jgi:hypothetical protein